MLTKNGALNQMLEAAGLGLLRQDWLGDPKIALLSVGAVIIWREAVLGVVLFVARLLSLSTEPLEAAMVDGATRWRAHWSVTLPQMRGIIGFYAITSVITDRGLDLLLRLRDDQWRPRQRHDDRRSLHLPECLHGGADEPRRLRGHPGPHRRHRGRRRLGAARRG